PVFSSSLGNLCREFMSRTGDGVSQVVDIGCGDGALIRALAREKQLTTERQFYGVDRNLGRAVPDPRVTYVRSLDEIPAADSRLIISNELFDALPFARLVQRGEQLHDRKSTRLNSSHVKISHAVFCLKKKKTRY